jgi:hypothetical protein
MKKFLLYAGLVLAAPFVFILAAMLLLFVAATFYLTCQALYCLCAGDVTQATTIAYTLCAMYGVEPTSFHPALGAIALALCNLRLLLEVGSHIEKEV